MKPTTTMTPPPTTTSPLLANRIPTTTRQTNTNLNNSSTTNRTWAPHQAETWHRAPVKTNSVSKSCPVNSSHRTRDPLSPSLCR